MCRSRTSAQCHVTLRVRCPSTEAIWSIDSSSDAYSRRFAGPSKKGMRRRKQTQGLAIPGLSGAVGVRAPAVLVVVEVGEVVVAAALDVDAPAVDAEAVDAADGAFRQLVARSRHERAGPFEGSGEEERVVPHVSPLDSDTPSAPWRRHPADSGPARARLPFDDRALYARGDLGPEACGCAGASARALSLAPTLSRLGIPCLSEGARDEAGLAEGNGDRALALLRAPEKGVDP